MWKIIIHYYIYTNFVYKVSYKFVNVNANTKNIIIY